MATSPAKAKPKATPTPAATPTRSTTRDYVVCRIGEDGKTLTVAEPQVNAKNRDDAMDQVHAKLSTAEQQQTVVLAAFLLNGYGEKTYRTRQQFVTESTARKTFFEPTSPPAVAAD